MDNEFLKESFKVIRVQAFEQVLELLSKKLHTTSDPRSIVRMMDEVRVMIDMTKSEKL